MGAGGGPIALTPAGGVNLSRTLQGYFFARCVCFTHAEFKAVRISF